MTRIPTRSRPEGREAIVLAGGDPVDERLAALLPADAVVIAADSGLASAEPLGLDVDVIVGDLDSVDPDLLAEARDAGIPIDAHDPDKDRTDLAIALDTAVERGATHIVVVGGHGGRLDHLIANTSLLASPAYRQVEIVALMGRARVTVIHGELGEDRHRKLRGRPGDHVSLVAYHGSARGITTTGLRFPLDDAELAAGSSLGVSNEFAVPEATVALQDGVLLAIQP